MIGVAVRHLMLEWATHFPLKLNLVLHVLRFIGSSQENVVCFALHDSHIFGLDGPSAHFLSKLSYSVSSDPYYYLKPSYILGFVCTIPCSFMCLIMCASTF